MAAMANEQRGVTVTHLVHASVSNPDKTNYPDVSRIRVDDQHLVLYGSEGKVVAAYAPGKWLRAEKG
jgi:hypothetical protein